MKEWNKRDKILKRSKTRLLLVSLLLNLIVVALLVTSSPTVSPASSWLISFNKAAYRIGLKGRSNLKELHANAFELVSEDCISCHGDMKKSHLPLHRIHLASSLTNFRCINCHRKVNLEARSNEKAVLLVDVKFCKNCHSRFSGLEKESAMKPVDFQADCTLCHTGKHAFRHAKPYLSQIISSQDCKVCHGERVLPWRKEHAKPDWIKHHGKFALSGDEDCMSCHEYGLAFCNDCHRKKPPSHQPKDLWLRSHKKQAKDNTKACLTCHKQEFCKKCHVGHTPEWLENHYSFVLEKGAESCQHCHSSIFCESCHVKVALPFPSEEGR
jgi:hypothetical protein